MFMNSNFSKKLLEKLSRKAYRAAYVGEHVRRGISAQIRAMRDQRGWNQGKLSTELGKPQSVVSRLEDPSYGKVTVQTLLEVASTFDVALQIRFVPFSAFLAQTRDVSPASMHVIGFDSDDFSAKPLRISRETGYAKSFAIGNVGLSNQNLFQPLISLPTSRDSVHVSH